MRHGKPSGLFLLFRYSIHPVFDGQASPCRGALNICSKTPAGAPCCDWIGEGGAGHFVKMVHNGIEYGDMQLISEAYQLMKDGVGMSNQEMHEAFAEWNKGELDSYLIEITRDILGYKDDNGDFVVDQILDKAGRKGTGKWTVVASLDTGTPLTLVTEAVLARCLSGLKDARVAASKVLTGPKKRLTESGRIYPAATAAPVDPLSGWVVVDARQTSTSLIPG